MITVTGHLCQLLLKRFQGGSGAEDGRVEAGHERQICHERRGQPHRRASPGLQGTSSSLLFSEGSGTTQPGTCCPVPLSMLVYHPVRILWTGRRKWCHSVPTCLLQACPPLGDRILVNAQISFCPLLCAVDAKSRCCHSMEPSETDLTKWRTSKKLFFKI